jgi:hypothetical protein
MYDCACFRSLWICWLHKYFVNANIQIKLLQAQYVSFALWPPFKCSILIFKSWELNMIPWSLFWPLKLFILWSLAKYSIWIEFYLMFWAYYNHIKILFATHVTVSPCLSFLFNWILPIENNGYHHINKDHLLHLLNNIIDCCTYKCIYMLPLIFSNCRDWSIFCNIFCSQKYYFLPFYFCLI